MEKQTEAQTEKHAGKSILKSGITVSITEMLVIVFLFVLINTAIFYITFGTLNIHKTGIQTGVNVEGTETVDYTKYQTVWFTTPQEPDRAFAVKINDPAVIYMMGYLDMRLSRSNMTMEYRLRELENEVRRLSETIKEKAKDNGRR